MSNYITPGQTMGAPSFYTDELADYIANVISKTHLADEYLCNTDPKFPCVETMYEWKERHPYFANAYSRAKRAQIELRMENVEKELLNEDKDFREGENGRLYANTVRAARLRSHAGILQWRASRLLAEKYGDTKPVEQTQVVITTEVLEKAHKLMGKNNGGSSSTD